MQQCHACKSVYCSSCSVINYDEREDRIFCLDCNTDSMQVSIIAPPTCRRLLRSASIAAVYDGQLTCGRPVCTAWLRTGVAAVLLTQLQTGGHSLAAWQSQLFLGLPAWASADGCVVPVMQTVQLLA